MHHFHRASRGQRRIGTSKSQLAVIVITNPYGTHQIGCVTHEPPITRCAGLPGDCQVFETSFCSSSGAPFGDVRQHVSNHVRRRRSDYLSRGRQYLVERLRAAIHHSRNHIRLDQLAAVYESSISGCNLKRSYFRGS